MLARIDDADGQVFFALHTRLANQVLQRHALFHTTHAQTHGDVVFRQRPAGVRHGITFDRLRCAHTHHLATRIAALGAEVDQPIGGTHHVQVVFNDDDGVARIQQLAKRAHQFGDVVKVQAGGGLVEHEERAAFGQLLFAGGGGLGCFRQETRQLQTLRFATTQGGHGLAELHIVQPHIDNGLQHTQHLAVLGEELHGF